MKVKTSGLQQQWWFKALQVSLIGWMFAISLAVCFVLLQINGVTAIKVLEQSGIDLGMKFYSNTPSASFAYQFLYVDVDQEACKLFMHSQGDLDPECRTGKPVPASLIIDFVRAASSSNASIVIVDVSPPEKYEETERQLLGHQLAQTITSKTWIIAPVYARPRDAANSLSLEGDTRFDIVPNYGQGRLRLASVLTYADNGITRVYPVASCLKDQMGYRWIPTVPHLAALLANPLTTHVVDKQYFDIDPTADTHDIDLGINYHDCGKLEVSTAIFSENINSASQFFDPLDMNRIPPIIQFFYSVPGLSQVSRFQDEKYSLWEHTPAYQHLEASKLINSEACSPRSIDGQLIKSGCFSINPTLYEDKIIVLGSSRAQAMDHVQTPIGPMSGSELIINATRAFLEFSPLKQPHSLVMLWNKLIGIAIAMIPMTIAWLLIFASEPVSKQLRLSGLTSTRKCKVNIIRQFRWRFIIFLRSIFVVIIFLFGMYSAYLLEVIYFAHQLEQGVAVDLLLPAVALGLQGFTVGARIISSFLQRIAGVVLKQILIRFA